MTVSMYDAAVPVFRQMLGSLSAILEKAEAHASARKIEPAALLQARLYPDMFPLTRQVQIAADFAKGACARLAGVEVPRYEDTEQSFGELRQRIEKTLAFIEGLPREAIAASEARDIVLTVAGNTREFKGQPYLLHYALPNFYFHLTTAYAILRHSGVEIGKRDFIGSF
ncbi:DUF1993 domain-containing protein [Massilia agilis]|uniref:DUF1993 domain-containing protein n=1 Tax=Massilia agilis TaxID=1811226 RepID=A0ABT2DA31_9BURK|nr:DUF1993 domain-containing protein [Massilia agilis]MCS0808150.1 DUF1993 domain-containing protein [Massilia agilis]